MRAHAWRPWPASLRKKSRQDHEADANQDVAARQHEHRSEQAARRIAAAATKSHAASEAERAATDRDAQRFGEHERRRIAGLVRTRASSAPPSSLVRSRTDCAMVLAGDEAEHGEEHRDAIGDHDRADVADLASRSPRRTLSRSSSWFRPTSCANISSKRPAQLSRTSTGSAISDHMTSRRAACRPRGSRRDSRSGRTTASCRCRRRRRRCPTC